MQGAKVQLLNSESSINGSARTCRWCLNLDLTGQRNRVEHSLKDFSQHADSTSCQGCKLIKSGLMSCDGQSLDDFRRAKESRLVICFTTTRGLTATVYGGGRDAAYDLDVQFYTPTKETWHPMIQYADPNECTASEGTFHRIKNILKDCQTRQGKHDNCAIQDLSKQVVLNRVLDIGARTPYGFTSTIKIVALSGMGTKYACLSHSWGSNGPSLQLHKSNVEQFKERINWEDLPKTFQDAIVCCRRLEINYLWIDSLCIIQDDIDDWRREAANMSNIYSNSSLCIAAAHTADDSLGLFSQPHPAFPLKFLDLSGISRTVYVRRCRLGDVNMWKAHASPETEQPLLKRGWVLQERLLSPRVLYFCKNDLVFDCHGVFTGEYKPAFIVDGCIRGLVPHKWNSPDFDSGSSSTTPWDLHASWRDLVEVYTKLRLSFSRDKLPAIAGVARETGKLRQSTYLSGLWADSLLDDLLWSAEVPPGHLQDAQPPPWRAPTWSWASCSLPVTFHSRKSSTRLCEFVSARCSPVGSDQYGEVTSGSIVLKGRLSRFRLHLFNKKLLPPFQGPISKSSKILQNQRHRMLPTRSLAKIKGVEKSGDASMMTWLTDGPILVDVPFDTITFFFPILSFTTKGVHGGVIGLTKENEFIWYFGLVLKPAEGETFERMGLIWARWFRHERGTEFDKIFDEYVYDTEENITVEIV